MPAIRGEDVTVRRQTLTGYDDFHSPVYEWQAEDVSDAVIAPGATEDLDETRPEGVSVTYTVHFPKSYTASLRGCHVVVRGEEYAVVGDPQAYTDANVPGRWDRPVEVSAVDG